MAANASWRLAAVLVRVAVGLVSVPLMTRMLGMSQWGLLALFQAATSPLALLDMGLGAATVKYVAELLGRGDRMGAVRVFHTTLIYNLAVGIAGALALVLSSRWLATSLFAVPPQEVELAVTGFQIMAASWLVGTFTATVASVLSANQRYDVSSRLATIGVVLTTGAGVATAAIGGDIVAVLVVQTIASAALGMAYLLVASRMLPGITSRPRWHQESFRRSFGFGVWQGVAIGGGMLSGWGDRYVLGAFFAPTVVGFYSVVHLLYSQLYVVFLEMGEVLFPVVSHLEGEGDLHSARRLTLLVAWTLSTGFGVAACVLAVVGGDFVHLWISPEAARASTATLRLLCVAGILGMPAIALFYYLLGIGKTKWDAASALTVGITVVGVDLVLVPRIGMVGLGYGLIAGVLVRWVFLVGIWRVHFSSQFRFRDFGVQVYIPAVISAALLLGLARIHGWLNRPVTWPWLLCEAIGCLTIAVAGHLAVGELLPDGRQRLRDVVVSFRPVVSGFLQRHLPSREE
jgi:O-antigen/teichoic acid export membrane protein